MFKRLTASFYIANDAAVSNLLHIVYVCGCLLSDWYSLFCIFHSINFLYTLLIAPPNVYSLPHPTFIWLTLKSAHSHTHLVGILAFQVWAENSLVKRFKFKISDTYLVASNWN